MKSQVITVLLALTVALPAFADPIEILKAHQGVYALENPAEQNCSTTELAFEVNGTDVTVRELGIYSFSNAPYDLSFTYKGVNQGVYKTYQYVNAVTQRKQVVFESGELKIQSKMRSVIFPIPWAFISWQDERVILSLTAQGNLVQKDGTCRMVKR